MTLGVQGNVNDTWVGAGRERGNLPINPNLQPWRGSRFLPCYSYVQIRAETRTQARTATCTNEYRRRTK